MSPTPPASGSWTGSHMSVAEETAKQRTRIDALRQAVAGDIPQGEAGKFYDDLFLLRFCMSNADLAVAESTLRETIKWRTENAETLARLAKGGAPPHDDIIGPYCLVAMHKALDDGSPLLIIRSGLTNTPALLEVATIDQIADWILYQREALFALCDKATRETGRLVKTVAINDFSHLSMAAMDRRFFGALGKASKASEIYYPQLMGMGLMINLPSWMSAIMTLARRFMSQRTLSKLRFCGAPSTLGRSLSACPVASTIATPSSLPSFLGGSCGTPECPHLDHAGHVSPGCIGGAPNSQSQVVLPRAVTTHKPGSTRIRVHARETKEVSVGRAPFAMSTDKDKDKSGLATPARLVYAVVLHDGHTGFAMEEVSVDGGRRTLVGATKGSCHGEVEVAAGCEAVARFEGKGWFSGSDVEYRFEWLDE